MSSTRLNFLSTFLSLLLLAWTPAFGQMSANVRERMGAQADSVLRYARNLPGNEKKVEWPLLMKINRMTDENAKTKMGPGFGREYSDRLFPANDAGELYVDAQLLRGLSSSDASAIESSISQAGGTVALVSKPMGSFPIEIYSWIPFDQIENIAKLSNVGNIGIVARAKARTGSVDTQGDTQLQALSAREAFYTDGTGVKVKVGVISGGATDWQQDVSSGDLPNNVNVIATGSGDEGTAMMEIVHDIAPAASLEFAGLGSNGANTMANYVAQMANDGCKVIVDDEGFPYGGFPFFDADSSQLLSTINYYVNNGYTSYVTAAGNDGLQCWDNQSPITNADGWVVFGYNGGLPDTLNSVTVPSGDTLIVDLQWADAWGYSLDNYSLFLYDQNLNQLASAPSTQTGNGVNPDVTLEWVNTTSFSKFCYIAIQESPSSQPRELKMITTPDGINLYYNKAPNHTYPSNQIYGQATVYGVVSAGAYPAANENGTESYSSWGPSNIYTFDQSGNQRGEIQRQTPTITATDDVNTYVGEYLHDFPNPFTGTSAAAPHVAGIAALYFSRYGFNNGSFISALEAGGDTIGTKPGGVYDDQTGWGRADAFKTLIGGLQVATNQTVASNTSWTLMHLEGTTTIESNVQVMVPAQTTSFIEGTVDFGSSAQIVVSGTLIVGNGVNLTGHVSVQGGMLLPENPYFVTVDQKLADGVTSVDSIGRWQSSSFSEYAVPASIPTAIGNTEVLRATQKIVSSQKYNNWNDSANVIDPHSFPISDTVSIITSHLAALGSADTIKSFLYDNPSQSLTIQFQDPWLVDSTGAYGPMNRGFNAPFKSLSSPFVPSSSPQYQGVFTNQSGPPNWNPPYYSISFPSQSISVGGTNHQLYFLGWSASGATVENPNSASSPVVFTSSSATVKANVKGSMLSNDASAYSDNSQRKFVRIPDSQGHMFQVYTSMGHAWLESSTDGGQTWNLEYGGRPLDYNTNAYAGSPGSKCPSIDYYYNSTGGQDYVIVVFEEPTGNGYYTLDYLNLWYDPNPTTGDYNYYFPRTLYTESADPYSTNANPNVMIGSDGFVMTLERKSSSGGSPGINWIGGYLDIDGNITNASPVNVISGTNANSVNASVYCSKATSPFYFDPAVAWQQNNGTNSSDIMLAFVNFNYSGNSWTFSQSPVQDISTNLGDGDDYRPSVVEMADNSVRVCWITDQGGLPQPQFINVAYWSSANQYGYGTYGTNPLSVSINATDDGKPIFVWSQSGSNTASDNGTNMENLNTTGRDVQLCNADMKSDMYVSSYYPSTLPYYFQTSKSLSGLQKSGPAQVVYGRGLSLGKGGLRFRYSLGDLIVDGNSINFVGIPDSTGYGNLDTLNGIFETEPFQINDNSKILFTQDSGFLDSAAAAIAFGDTGFIRCHADLIDNSTGKLIGNIEDETFSNRNTGSYALARYQLNADGAGTKTVRVRFSVTTNIKRPQAAYVNSYRYENQIDSSNVQSFSLQQLDIIRNYTLSQNYPNPFNPTTVISYAIPKAGHVSLKIYDVLGREVEALVNDNQNVGRYEVNFDGSRLASGVYFYRLVAGKHIITKKMLMLK